MAQRNSSGRGTTATRTKRQPGNQTPNTPRVSESDISRMKVDDIRSQLRRRGVSGTSALRKPELVKTLARTMRSEGRGGAARRSTGPAGRPAAKKTAAAKKTTAARRKATSPAKSAPAARATGARAKATGTRRAAPARAKATASRAKAAPARKASSARATTSPSRAKAAPSRAKAAPSRAKAAPSRAKAAPARKAASARAQAAPTLGPASSRSIGSSQLITSLADRPERPGRSLVTRNHEVIQRWARARGAKPATIAGTERGDRPGVLTFNIPGYRESSRIREVTWDDWFRTFDSRRLNLIYQEQMRDGRQSNFFRTENPNREDG
ncbi:hypothetical protein COO58_26630 [Micromonospora sp. WMMA1996]|nr:hypothetical protein COO58_26630 [Micromonospora sp. WMMA1996]